MKRRSVVFAGPRQVRVEEEPLPTPRPGEVLVETTLSAISAGTEMLVYRDQFPPEVSVDSTIGGMQNEFAYPLRYGYACVGRVTRRGDAVDETWQGRRVFAFQPHTSHFVAEVETLFPVPEGLTDEQAIFLPNMETAVGLLQDGAPLLGERVVVFGQGIVGLLVTSLLAQFPLERLTAVDAIEARREASLGAGAHEALPPTALDDGALPATVDLLYEISGDPAALNQAIALAGYGGRIVVGSWYGQKQAALNLGGRFHRERLRLISSQVSTIAPELRGRWDKTRRLAVTWNMLAQVNPGRWITHRLPVHQAPDAYRMLDLRPSEAIQVVLTYGESQQ